MSNKKNQKGGDITSLSTEKEQKLKRLDSWHDFGHPHSDRFAPGGLKKNEKEIAGDSGKAPPSVVLPIPLYPANELVLSMNNNRLYRANKKKKDGSPKYQYQNDECSSKVRMRKVSYERLATAALDSCTLENAWTKDNMLSWDEIYDQSANIWDSSLKKWKDTANFNYSDILIIADGNDIKKSYASTLRKPSAENQKRRNIVGNFIIKYMFPDYQGNEPVAITYDAAGGKATKVFSGMGQVKALITPQNISDSAKTKLDPFSAFKDFGHKRTEFLFPQSEGETIWKAKSQYYSKNWCKIEYENVDFNTNSPNGFRIKIDWNQLISDPSVDLSFTIDYATLGYTNPKDKSGSASSGPSAPYLKGLVETIIGNSKSDALRMLQGDTSLQPNKGTNIIPLYNMINEIYISLLNLNYSEEDAKQMITGLLLDLKRSGDYEQANAAQWAQGYDPSLKVILSTGDVLCSTYSRSMRQACILQGIGPSSGQGADAIALFRFPTTGISSSLPENYDEVKSFFDSIEESTRKLNDLSRKGEKYAKATLTVTELSDTLQRLSNNGQLNSNIPPFNQKNPNLNPQDQSTMTIMATNICNSLLKLKYAQVYSSLSPSQEDDDDAEKATQGLVEFNYPNLNSHINVLLDHKQDILRLIREPATTGVVETKEDMVPMKESAWDKFYNILQQHKIVTSKQDAEQKTNAINELINLQSLIEAGSPVTDKIISKNISKENIQSFFSEAPYFPLYKKPNDSQKNVNNFLKSIGLDIGLFFKVFSNFIKFLSAIPNNLAKVQKYLDKYEKRSLSVLGKQYNDQYNANNIFEAIAAFVPSCLSYFNNIREETVLEYAGIPDERRKARIIEAQIKKKLKSANSYGQPTDTNFITFLMRELNSLDVAASSLSSTQPLSSQFPTANSTSSIPVAVSDTMDASMGDNTNMSFGGGSKIKQKGGVIKEKFITTLELLQNLSSQCDSFITDGISMNFTSNPETPNDCEGLRIVKFQIYSILFNTYKSLNRFYNATTSFVDENNKTKISQPSWQDLGATLLSLSQQINAMNMNCMSDLTKTRAMGPQIGYIHTLLNWIVDAANDIKTAGGNGNFAAVRTSPRFTPTNCDSSSGLSTACRKLNELWSKLNSQPSTSSSGLDLSIASIGLNSLISFINEFFESDYIVNLQKEFYEQTLISCMYTNESLGGISPGDVDEEIRMANIKEFEDDIIDMWNETLYEDLDLDEGTTKWEWKEINRYTMIYFTENYIIGGELSMINEISRMLATGNFIYTLACMYNLSLLNENTFNPYVSVYSKYNNNPLAQQIAAQSEDCIDKYKLSFYTPAGIVNVLQQIKLERFQNLSNFGTTIHQSIKLTSPQLYMVEIIKKNSFGKLRYMLLRYSPRNGSKPKKNMCENLSKSTSITLTRDETEALEQFEFAIRKLRERRGSKLQDILRVLGFDNKIRPNRKENKTKQKAMNKFVINVKKLANMGVIEKKGAYYKMVMGGGYRKKKTRRRKKRKYKTIRRRKKYRKRTLKRKKRKKKTRFKK